MERNSKSGFTLVELLVVIGIIAILVGILLPALNRARDMANTIACSSNLRSIGQGIAQYEADYRGVFPPSNFYNGTDSNPFILDLGSQTQLPLEPINGYVHWSSFLFAQKDRIGQTSTYTSLEGWKVFQCPALQNGGLPPANTYSGNLDIGQQSESPGVIDWQAPRLAYTVNEALCPRGIFVQPFDSRGNVRVYKFIQASRVKNSSGTILATELWGTLSAESIPPLVGGAPWVSGSRRPVSGIAAYGNYTADQLYKYTYSNVLGSPNSSTPWAGSTTLGGQYPADDLNPAPETQLSPSQYIFYTTLDWVGRNHGPKKLGPISFGSSSTQWDLRKTNFLYVDGHVETKHITETILPTNQWGDEFYTLDK